MELLGIGRQAEVYAVSETECVKLFYKDCPASIIENEEKKMRFAFEHGAPSPKCYGIVEMGDRLGIKMERLRGVTMLRESLNARRDDFDYTFELGRLQREYHKIDATGLGDMASSLINSIGYTDLLTKTQKSELAERLLKMPAGNKLVHMDYHADNVMLVNNGVYIIDWSGACAGNPLADAARTVMTMELKAYPPDADEDMRRFIDETRQFAKSRYLAGYGADLRDIEAWRPFIAAARLCCCPTEERADNLQAVRAFLD